MLPRRRRLASSVTPVVAAAIALVALAAPAHSRPVGESVVTTARAATRTVDVAYTAGPLTMQKLLDRCDGPVAVRFDGMRQRLLAEHDYCGGRWVLGLDTGDIVRVYGGDIGGRYRVNGDIKIVPKGTSASVLRGMGSVVAQTCRPDGDTLRLVGLTRLD